MELQVEQVDDVRADRIQEVAVVGDDHQRLFPAHEVLLQPQHRPQIQVVRGFVEKQEGGLDEESARERDPHSPPAAEGLGSSALQDRIELVHPHICKRVFDISQVQAVLKMIKESIGASVILFLHTALEGFVALPP